MTRVRVSKRLLSFEDVRLAALLLLTTLACNSGSGTDCSASCAAIADEIHEAGAPPVGACVDPEPKIEALCQELAHCSNTSCGP